MSQILKTMKFLFFYHLVKKIQLNSAQFKMIQILEVVFDKIIVFATLQNLESLQKSKFYTIFANL